MAGMGKGIEQLAGRAVASKYVLHFARADSIEEGIRLWQEPIKVAMPFLRKFGGVIEDGLKNEADVKTALEEFASSLEAIMAHVESLKTFRLEVVAD
jgi:hypothetical protein